MERSLESSINKLNLNISTNTFIDERLAMYEQLRAKQVENQKNLPRLPIKCIIPHSHDVEGVSNETTPKSLIRSIKTEKGGGNKQYVVARVNGQLWDLSRPLETDSIIEYLTFDDPDGKHVFWHSSAHILGQALEIYYGAKLCSGPPFEHGFYYNVFMDERVVVASDLKEIEKICKTIIHEKQVFERVIVSKTDLMLLFKDNKFKQRILTEKVVDDYTTVYRCGNLVDLCRGPHVEHTGAISAMAVIKNSAVYYEGKNTNESLQRVYAISFPNNAQLKEWIHLQEEAEKRDHRKLGRDHELFFFHELSPGSCFFLPKGAHIYNKLTEFIRVEYRKRGFTEVISPNIYNVKLWKSSGHYDNYAENMFMFNVEGEEFAMKPMNCPGHCLMYNMRPRSHKELPLRFADFGVLHRNEFSGALSGLTRVRRFCQDDAHIFCKLDQVGEEIHASLQFLFYVHSILGFDLHIKLSTRPAKSIGDDATWEKAEEELTHALNRTGHSWELNPGDGAFYGPKIDIQVKDALSRLHQLSTIQLDFNLPARFQLKYVNSDDSFSQPVMIHRAILGSLERVIGILTESYAGKWPFWLSPHQVAILSLHPDVDDYAHSVLRTLSEEGYMCTIDTDPTVSFNKKIRNATQTLCNFIFVLGHKEKDDMVVSMRTRTNKQINAKVLTEVLEKFKQLEKSYSSNDELEF